jgi:hypothetical protein
MIQVLNASKLAYKAATTSVDPHSYTPQAQTNTSIDRKTHMMLGLLTLALALLTLDLDGPRNHLGRHASH